MEQTPRHATLFYLAILLKLLIHQRWTNQRSEKRSAKLDGKGCIGIHSATDSFRECPEYRAI